MTKAIDSKPDFPPEGLPSWFFPVSLSLSAAIFYLDLTMPLGFTVNMLYFIVIVISFWVPLWRGTIQLGILTTILTIIGFFFSPPGGEFWKVLFNRLMGVAVVWITVWLIIRFKIADLARKMALEERQKALDEIKILQGILPICSACKKIRDKAGQWKQMEVYIRDHSEADFTHGVCPECIKKLYPEFGKK